MCEKGGTSMKEKQKNTAKRRTLFRSEEVPHEQPLAVNASDLPIAMNNTSGICSGISQNPDGTRTGISFEKVAVPDSGKKD